MFFNDKDCSIDNYKQRRAIRAEYANYRAEAMKERPFDPFYGLSELYCIYHEAFWTQERDNHWWTSFAEVKELLDKPKFTDEERLILINSLQRIAYILEESTIDRCRGAERSYRKSTAQQSSIN